MVGDRFNVVSLGIGINGAGHRQVVSQLMQKFQLDRKQAIGLMNRKTVIKRSVDWNTAEEYLEKLTQAGMAADIDVAMSRELFLDSLEQRNVIRKKSTISPRHTLELDLKNITPKLWTKADSSIIKSSNKKTLFNINNLNPSISYAGCLIATAIVISAVLYFLSLLAGDVIPGNIAIAIGVIFVPLAIAYLPSLFSIRRMVHFTTGAEQQRVGMICVEKPQANPLNRHYDFYNRAGKQIAYVTQRRLESGNLNCYSPNGDLMLSLRPYLSTKESMKQLYETVKTCISKKRYQDLITVLFKYYGARYQNEDLHREILNREISPKSTIKDASDRPVALLYKERFAYIEIAARQPDEYPLPCI